MAILSPILQPICGPILRGIADKGAGAFSPTSLFASGQEGAWFDPSDLSTLFQDIAGTIPVTASGQPVGLMKDKSGNGNHATAAADDTTRPTFMDDGTNRWVGFDRTMKQQLLIGNLNLFRNMPSAFVSMALRCSNFAQSVPLFVSTPNAVSSRLFIGMYNDNPAVSVIGRRLDADTTKTAIAVAAADASTSMVIAAQFGYQQNQLLTYRDGVAAATAIPFQGVGNSSDTASAVISIGHFAASTSGYFTGRIYGMVIRIPWVTDAARGQVEQYLKKKIMKPELPASINVFLVWGQSNTDGRVPIADGPSWIQDGFVDQVSVWDSAALSEFDLSKAGPSGNGTSWVTSQSVDKFSFAPIAMHAISQSIANVVVCQVTSGATPIAAVTNTNGSWNADYASIPDGTPALLEALQDRYAALVAYCTSNSITLNLLGVIGHQGESDSRFVGADVAYADNFAALVAKIRAFTGHASLPIFYGTIPPQSLWYSSVVVDAQVAFAANDANAYCRDNSDLTLLPDGLHFDSPSAQTFGAWVSEQVLSA